MSMGSSWVRVQNEDSGTGHMGREPLPTPPPGLAVGGSCPILRSLTHTLSQGDKKPPCSWGDNRPNSLSRGAEGGGPLPGAAGALGPRPRQTPSGTPYPPRAFLPIPGSHPHVGRGGEGQTRTSPSGGRGLFPFTLSTNIYQGPLQASQALF